MLLKWILVIFVLILAFFFFNKKTFSKVNKESLNQIQDLIFFKWKSFKENLKTGGRSNLKGEWSKSIQKKTKDCHDPLGEVCQKNTLPGNGFEAYSTSSSLKRPVWQWLDPNKGGTFLKARSEIKLDSFHRDRNEPKPELSLKLGTKVVLDRNLCLFRSDILSSYKVKKIWSNLRT